MRVLVCGSRHFKDWETLDGVLSSELHEDDILIHGDARGADRLAASWFSSVARDPRRQIIPYPAKWNEHGKVAGPIRNKQMLGEGKPDLVIAFRGPNSRGTQNMIDQATKAGVPVKVINI